MSDKFFGQYLLAKGILSREQFQQYLAAYRQSNPKIGELACREGLLGPSEVEEILSRQRSDDRRFGEIAVELGSLSPGQVETLLNIQRQRYQSFAQILLDARFLPEAVIQNELRLYGADEQKKDGMFGLTWVESNIHVGKIVAALVAETVRLIKLLADMEVREGESRFDRECLEDLDILVVEELSGEHTLSYLFNATRNVILAVAGGIMGSQGTSLSEELFLDAGREFVNMVCGNAITRLSRIGVSLKIGVPKVQKFKRRYHYRFSKKHEVLVVPVVVSEGAIEIAVASESLYRRG